MLTFNTDAGKEEIDIDVTSLVDTYNAGDGLNLADHTFSLKIDTTSTGHENFLSVSESGLKISGVQTAINTAKEEAITAAGKVNLVQSTTDGHVLTFTNSAGTSKEITIPDTTLKWGSF